LIVDAGDDLESELADEVDQAVRLVKLVGPLHVRLDVAPFEALLHPAKTRVLGEGQVALGDGAAPEKYLDRVVWTRHPLGRGRRRDRRRRDRRGWHGRRRHRRDSWASRRRGRRGRKDGWGRSSRGATGLKKNSRGRQNETQ